MTTVALEGDLAANMIKMKQDEIGSGKRMKMGLLTSLIVFDKVGDEVEASAKNAEITIYHIDEVIAKGKKRIAKGNW